MQRSSDSINLDTSATNDALDPTLALVDALYAFAEQPDKWLTALEAIEKLPLNFAAEDNSQRLTSHVERAAALAQTLNRARQDATNPEERWDAVLLSTDKQVRAIAGNPSEHLSALLKTPLSLFEKPEFTPEAKHGFDAAFETSKSMRFGGLAHWVTTSEQTGEKSLALIISRSTFPQSLGRAFGLSELGPEPLFALAILSADSDSGDTQLRDSLGLTRAEWRLAQTLKLGASVTDAATQLNISVNTARTQIKSIFSKLGVARQSELVSRLSLAERVALRSAPPSHRPAQQAPPRQFHVLADNRRLAYREYGDPRGVPTLVLHQWFAASMLPGPAMEEAHRSGLRLIAFDRPGFGQSTPVANYSLKGVVLDAMALADHLKISRLRLLGMAPGAAFAITAATLFPSRIERIALAAPRLRKKDGVLPARTARGQLSGLMRQPWLIKSFLAMMRSGAGERIAMSLLKHATAHSPSDRREASKPATARAILAQGFDAHESCTEGFTSELQLFATLEHSDLDQVTCPIAVWHGEDDPVTPYQQSTEEFSKLPNASMHIVKGEGVIFSRNSYADIFQWLRE